MDKFLEALDSIQYTYDCSLATHEEEFSLLSQLKGKFVGDFLWSLKHSYHFRHNVCREIRYLREHILSAQRTAKEIAQYATYLRKGKEHVCVNLLCNEKYIEETNLALLKGELNSC